jgi:hypothetical protein
MRSLVSATSFSMGLLAMRGSQQWRRIETGWAYTYPDASSFSETLRASYSRQKLRSSLIERHDLSNENSG